MPPSSDCGPGSVSSLEEEEQVQRTVTTCPASSQQGKIRVKSRAGLRPRPADAGVFGVVSGLFSVTALVD